MASLWGYHQTTPRNTKKHNFTPTFFGAGFVVVAVRVMCNGPTENTVVVHQCDFRDELTFKPPSFQRGPGYVCSLDKVWRFGQTAMMAMTAVTRNSPSKNRRPDNYFCRVIREYAAAE